MPAIPTPEPRKVRKLPIVAMAVLSAGGILLFLWLWNVAVGLQEENTQKVGPGTYEAQ